MYRFNKLTTSILYSLFTCFKDADVALSCSYLDLITEQTILSQTSNASPTLHIVSYREASRCDKAFSPRERNTQHFKSRNLTMPPRGSGSSFTLRFAAPEATRFWNSEEIYIGNKVIRDLNMAMSNNDTEDSHISDHDQNVDRAKSSHSDLEESNVVDSEANAHHESDEHSSDEESSHHSSSDEEVKRKRSKTLSRKRERTYSDVSGRSSDSEMDSSKRKKRHRRPTHKKKKRRVHTSSSESSSATSGMSSDSEADSNSSGY